MARFRIRLEDPHSSEFRVVVTHADTEEEAVAVALRLEDKYVAFRMDDDELAEIQERAESPLRGARAAAGRLHMHNQAAPYEVVSVSGGAG